MRFRLFPRERSISEYLPLTLHLRDTVILLDDGSLFCLLEIHGLLWETLDPIDLLRHHAALNGTYQNIAHDTVVLHVYQCRGLANINSYPQSHFNSDFARRLDDAYRENLFANTLYENRLFLGIQIRPAMPMGEFIGEQVRKLDKPTEETPDDRLDRMENICRLIQFNLSAYKPRVLGIRDKRFSEIGEALVYAMTGVYRPIGLTTGKLGQSLFSEDIIVGRETIEFRGPGHSWFGAIFGMRHYPKDTHPGFINTTLTTSYRSTLYQSFRCLSTHSAQGVMHKKHVSMVSSQDTSKSQREALVRAADHLGSADFVMGDHCLSFLVFADTPATLRDVATAAWSDLSLCGATISRENIALEAAWASMCPGNLHLRPRPGYISSRNMTAFAPFHAFPSGHKKGYWGEAISVLRTVSGEPYYLQLHPPGSDVGNMLFTGMTGSGKTTLLAFLIAQASRLGAQVIVWDKDGMLKILVHYLGGVYLELKNPTGLAPLKALTDSTEDLDFLAELIRNCILSDGNPQKLTSEEDRRLYLALRIVMALPAQDRSMSEIRAFLGVKAEGAGARLEKWCWGNEMGGIIDNPEDLVSFSAPVIGFDKTFVLGHKLACSPVMAVLYHYTGKLADGRRLIYVDDEMWASLKVPAFAPMISNQLKVRARKGNSPTIAATQSPSDALNSDLADTIKEQCPTHIHFYSDASWEHYKELGRTRTEYDLVQNLKPGTGEFLISQNKISARVQLPLRGLDDFIAVLSARRGTKDLFDRLLIETDKPLEQFQKRYKTEASA